MDNYDIIGIALKCQICFEKAHLLYVWQMGESNGLSESIVLSSC